MTIFQQDDPNSNPNPKLIATQGFSNNHPNLQVAAQGLLPTLTSEELTDLFVGGEALLSTAVSVNADGLVVIQGAAQYEFNAVGIFEYDASGGVIIAGEADIYSNARAKKPRGGKGIVRPKKAVEFGSKPAHVYNYMSVPAKNKQKILIDDYLVQANASLKMSGQADTWFAQAEPDFEFIKTLSKPKKSAPVITVDSNFKILLKKLAAKPKPKIFNYISEGSLLALDCISKSNYVNYSDFIIKEDDELMILDMIYMDEKAIVSTTSNVIETRIRKDDLDIELLFN